MKTILITGAFGFLGSHAAVDFARKGFTVYGVGHPSLGHSVVPSCFNHLLQGSISLELLRSLPTPPDFILHAAGGSSVANSYADPLNDFKKTVDGTASLLEYVRLHSPKARVIYTSTAAVYGDHDANPILITDQTLPVSPYGSHKLLGEALCHSYRQHFGLQISVVRFFSIYGNGLRKQLLWDACKKLDGISGDAFFWGDGGDIRDWLHVSDATSLIHSLVTHDDFIRSLNAGSGIGTSVRNILSGLKLFLGSSATIRFKGEARDGDPACYIADLTESIALNWKAKISLHDGLSEYCRWFRQETNSS